MILYIDTTDFQTMRFALISNTVNESIFEIAHNENWKTLDFLERFLNKHKIDTSPNPSYTRRGKTAVINSSLDTGEARRGITKIIVCSGPGSFTGTRIGVTIAQGLAFAMQVPIFSIPTNKVPKDLLKLKTYKGNKIVSIEYHPEKNR